jgi:hypothetical protein
VDGRGCVGTVVDLYCFGHLFAILCRLLKVYLFSDSAMCVALLVPETNAKSQWKPFSSGPARVQQSS